MSIYVTGIQGYTTKENTIRIVNPTYHIEQGANEQAQALLDNMTHVTRYNQHPYMDVALHNTCHVSVPYPHVGAPIKATMKTGTNHTCHVIKIEPHTR